MEVERNSSAGLERYDGGHQSILPNRCRPSLVSLLLILLFLNTLTAHVLNS